ncbi:bifunctional diguanylate cyclase/phosphodiesterase [Methyloversatilis sp. MC4-4]|uniref:bifunctional diguanylate cyclase/phosphodiesterase n=1 Tax=Methyloversatilis sp. MC4-4 TaxID=3132824 RepID=UPI003CF82E51
MPLTRQESAHGASSLRPPAAICLTALLLLIGAAMLPPIPLFEGRHGAMLAFHLLLETFSVVVSALVVIMAWHRFDRSGDHASNVLIFGFSVVAGTDLIHALTYAGMPALLTESSTAKAIFFWLAGRSFELLTVALVAARIALPGSRGGWLGFGLLATGALFVAGTWFLDLFPVTFVPGVGVTAFKAGFEYVLCIGNLAVAGWLFWQNRVAPDPRTHYLACACFVMGIGELAFTNYTTASDFMNMFGHLYKIAAYTFVYRATFVIGLREPYELLQRSEQSLRERERELDTILSNVPADIARIDRDLRFRYVNPMHALHLGQAASDIVGRTVDAVMPPQLAGQMRPRLAEALQGQRVEFDCNFTGHDGNAVHLSSTLVPERSADGGIDSVVLILNDTTERERAQRRVLDSLREVGELKAALDAHAIVAETDARGVITRVNDKFCEISQYAREELVGRSHRVINSGTHAPGFFADMWKTISSGLVWHGDICNRAKDGSLYWVHTTIVPLVDADGVPQRYIAIRADITTRKKAEHEAQRLAFHDELTGLPNRRLMNSRLDQAIAGSVRDGQHGALLLMDLDNFKEINDTLGHAQGDALLQQMSARLRSCVRDTDTVARLGGDEFVVILGNLGIDLQAASLRVGEIGDKLRDALAGECDLGGQMVSSTASIGAVLFNCAEDRADELLKQADMALYKAKESGRNRLSFFDPTLQENTTARAQLLRDLRGALERGELRLHYQPVTDAERRITGVEALVRWQHPVRGMVSPAAFIPLAEQSNHILPIGQWVLDTACTQLRAWADDPLRVHWTIAVNVSERQFHESGFVGRVEQALADSGADPRRLRLELTESMLHRDLDMTLATMRTLQQRGVRFALDDFGTGYSSLAYLKKLPLDQLKIDKSFVDEVLSDPHSAAIVRTILSLAGNLGLNVVAEGVETEAQMAFLSAHGCDAFQGYLLSRPLPVEQLPHCITAAPALV